MLREVSSRKKDPEMQVEACLVPCNESEELIQPFFTSDISKLGQSTNNVQLTCPLASIYR